MTDKELRQGIAAAAPAVRRAAIAMTAASLEIRRAYADAARKINAAARGRRA